MQRLVGYEFFSSANLVSKVNTLPRSVAMAMFFRLQSAWRRHGPMGFAGLVVKNIGHQVSLLIHGRRQGEQGPGRSTFDTKLGTETGALREVGSLRIESPNARYAVRYQPSPDELVRKLIAELPIEHGRFAFVDFGAGKGLVLMIAAQWPFKQVIGVEFAAELCDIARSNLERPDPSRTAEQVSCVHADATTYALPMQPLVCYFYNPFGLPVMRAVADRIVASVKAMPREVWIVYVHPEHARVFDESGFWTEVAREDFFVVLRTKAVV